MMALDFGGPVEVPFEPWTYAELDHGVIARFRRIAAIHAESTAILDGEDSWTYGQLAAAVSCVQRALEDGSEPVAIEADFSRFTAAAMLGALAAGRPYVPLDPAFPEERNRHIREHSGARLMLTRAWLEDCCSRPVQDAPSGSSGHDVAYIIYTSGSTGRPKGVYQNQRNLLHDVMQYANAIHLSERDRLTMLYSPSVSGSIRDWYGALLTGASLHIHSVRQSGFARLRERVLAERITVYHSVPPVFRAFLAAAPGCFDSVRIVYLAGDRLETGDVDLFRRHFKRGAFLYTGIGSTEAATIYRHWFIDHDTQFPDNTVPVGRAIPDREVKLVDGEIEVSGRYIALGYWRDSELTAQRFATTPGDPQSRTFLPGDRGRERADGLLEFLGRADQQVKICGYRVEIGDVERALKQHPMVGDVAVVMAGGQLVGCYAGSEPIAWRPFLSPRLPSHMIPASFKRFEALPRLGNFKLDRVALEGAMAADFEALGGDSLAALQASLEREGRLHGTSTPDGRTLFYLPSNEGSLLGVQVLKSALESYGVLGLTYPRESGHIPEIAARLRDDIRRERIAGPYRLIGYSFGGRVAFELARQLALEGEAIEFLGIIDTPPSGPLELERVLTLRRAWHFARRLLRSPIALWPSIARHMRTRRPIKVDLGRRAAFLAYEPKPFDGELVLVRSRGDNLGWKALPEDLGWGQWCSRVRVQFYEGTHDIANPWSAASLNKAVGEELRRAAGLVGE